MWPLPSCGGACPPQLGAQTRKAGEFSNGTFEENTSGTNISYEKGRATPSQAGRLTAAFDGSHGWFWRNRTEEPVTVTLRVRGDYAELQVP